MNQTESTDNPYAAPVAAVADETSREMELAGRGTRLGAVLVDGLIFGLGTVPMIIAVFVLGGAGMGVFLVSMFVVFWGYPVAFEVFRDGQTPGKRAFGLKVVSDNGTPVTWLPSVVRNLLRTVDMLPVLYVFGVASSLVDPSGRRLGDLVAGTVVVYTERAPARPPPPMVAPLRPPLPLQLDEQRALIGFAERAPQMTAERQAELADVLRPVTHERGEGAVAALLGMANYLLGRR
jgi:uncharacterized RDD family membrane protein YckC